MLSDTGRKTPVIVNARFLTKSPTGVDRFAIEILGAWLPKFGDSRNASFVAPGRSPLRHYELGSRAMTRGRLNGHCWEQLELARVSTDVVLLNLCNTAPILRRQQLVVLHDAATMVNPRDYSVAFRSWYRMLFTGLMARAKVVASVSRFSADELIRNVGPRHVDIEVIYESGEHVLRYTSDPTILERLKLSEQPYVLAVGSLSLNKNFRGVAQAAEALTDLGIKIVAAGGQNTRIFAGVHPTNDTIVRAGYVTDGELRALYENAQCFVYPSFYEGFGLPPLEAMHCGCPVIVSRRASLPEVCGDAALYCDPADPADIARCVRRVVTSENLRNDLRAAGYARSAQFSWSRASDQLEDILSRHFDHAT
jgi:glycosyltransferase involved in cell wall biosynthesis